MLFNYALSFSIELKSSPRIVSRLNSITFWAYKPLIFYRVRGVSFFFGYGYSGST